MAKMLVAQISKPKSRFELVEREIPDPDPGTVRIKVQACGICHSDAFTVEGIFPGVQYPRVPGHEVAGIIDALGEGVSGWEVGQKVAVGWNGGYCGYCLSCRSGDFATCENLETPGLTYDGGYAEYMITPVNGLASIPEQLNPVEAGPLMCAGITTFNALRNSGNRPGDTVAILGIGGLGHLAVQFAAKMGFYTIAISRGEEKGPLAKKLGAHQYVNSRNENPAEKLQQFGGAKLILSTVTNAEAMNVAIGGLAVDGKFLIVGISEEPVEVTPLQLISKRASLAGWPSGSAKDSEDTMNFCAHSGVRSMNHTFPLQKAQEAYDLMMSGKARFRVVLTMED